MDLKQVLELLPLLQRLDKKQVSAMSLFDDFSTKKSNIFF